MKTTAVAFTSLLILTTGIAHAGVIVYSDRASFEAAITSFIANDFESLTDGNKGISVNFGPVTYANSSSVFVTTFFGAPSRLVGDQINRDTLITMAPGFNALGMNLGLPFRAGNTNVSLTEANNVNVLATNPAVADNNDLGTASTTFIASLSITLILVR